MKKIITILLITLIYAFFIKNITNINADNYLTLKPLIITTGYTYDLALDGYHIISSEVNFNESGSYLVKYQKNDTTDIYYRNIEVVDSNTIAQNKYFKTLLRSQIDLETNTEIIKITTYNLQTLVLLKVSDTYKIMIINLEDLSFYTYSININISDVKLIDMTCDEEYIYILGNVYTIKKGIDIYLCAISYDGNLCIEKTYGGLASDEGIIIKNYQDYLGIVALTSSNDDVFFATSSRDTDGAFLLISKDSFEVNKMIDNPLKGIDKIINVYLDDYIYLVQSYYKDNIYHLQVLLFDYGGNLMNTTLLPIYAYVNYSSLIKANNKIYLSVNMYDDVYNDTRNLLYELTSSLDYKLINNYYEDNLDLKSISTNDANTLDLLYVKDNKEIILKVLQERTISFTDTIMLSKIKNISNLNNHYFIVQDEDSLKIYSYSYLSVSSSFTLTEIDDNYTIPIIYYNTQVLDYVREKSNNNYNPFWCGKYDVLYYYEGDYFDFILQKQVEVKVNTNIASNEQYECGIILYFNGEATLNNYVIEKGYQINKVGLYQLVITTNNKEKIIYDFEVVDVANTLNNNFSNMTQLVISNDVIQDSDTNHEASVVISASTTNLSFLDDYQNKMWYMIIPIAILFIGLGSIYLFKRG